MNCQKSNIFAAIIFTLCVSLPSLNAEPSKTNLNGIPTKFALKKIIIPEVDFELLTLHDSLQTLTLQISHISDKHVTPNFIIKDLNGDFDNRRVTLNLSNIPAHVVLQYIADLVRGVIRYDRNSIVISPLRAARK